MSCRLSRARPVCDSILGGWAQFARFSGVAVKVNNTTRDPVHLLQTKNASLQTLIVLSWQRLLGVGFSPVPPGASFQQVILAGGASPCAGSPELLSGSFPILKCDLQKEEASVLCRDLECGTALQWSRAHQGAGTGSQDQKFVSCQGTEPSTSFCKINVNFAEQCDLVSYTQVVCTGRNAL